MDFCERFYANCLHSDAKLDCYYREKLILSFLGPEYSKMHGEKIRYRTKME